MTCCIKSCIRCSEVTGECELKRLDNLVEKDSVPCYHRKFKLRSLENPI